MDYSDMIALLREIKTDLGILRKETIATFGTPQSKLCVVAEPSKELTVRVALTSVTEQKKETQTRKPKAKRVKSCSSAKSKPAKSKQKQQQRAKEASPTGRYSFSASMRQFREHQLWFEVDPYYDREQSIFQLWTDVTRPPEDYDLWR